MSKKDNFLEEFIEAINVPVSEENMRHYKTLPRYHGFRDNMSGKRKPANDDPLYQQGWSIAEFIKRSRESINNK